MNIFIASPRPSTPKRTSESTPRTGFTLIEILVVLATITLLAALLFPVFSRAREAGRRIVCLSNLRQIGMGITQYAEDYGRWMPLRYADRGLDTRKNNWRVGIYPYVKSTEVFRCPSNPNNNQSATLTAPDQPIDIKVSYACNYNDHGLGVFGSEDGDFRVRLSSITSPAETIVVTESLSSEADMNTDNAEMIGQLFAGHLGHTNYLFADNHVKALRPLTTYYEPDGTIRNMWYRDLTPFF